MRLIREPEQPKTSPALSLKLAHRRYQSWKSFLTTLTGRSNCLAEPRRRRSSGTTLKNLGEWMAFTR